MTWGEIGRRLALLLRIWFREARRRTRRRLIRRRVHRRLTELGRDERLFAPRGAPICWNANREHLRTCVTQTVFLSETCGGNDIYLDVDA